MVSQKDPTSARTAAALRDVSLKISEAFRDTDFSEIERRIASAFPSDTLRVDLMLANLASLKTVTEDTSLYTNIMDESHSFKRTGTTPKKGKIIKSFVRDGRIYTLHATKGWRSRKVAG